MPPTETMAIVALTIYAIYRQSIRHPVVGRTRFKLALIYIVVGVARGVRSRLWREPDGRIFTQGTPLTIGLFLLPIGAKFALGTWRYLNHRPGQHGGFGEVLILIGLRVAMQAGIV